MKYLFLVLLLTGCGKSVIETQTQDQKVVVDGETYNYVVVRIEFIEQIRVLCQDLNLRNDFPSDELWKQEIAKCTFNNLDIVNLDPVQVGGFDKNYCGDGADVSQFSPEEQLNIQAVCEALGH